MKPIGPDDIRNLPAPPAGMSVIVRAAGDPKMPLNKLAKLIEGEPTFTIELLRVGNSPAIGAGTEIRTVQHATVALGARSVRNHAVAHIVRVLGNRLDLEGFDGVQFWEDSLRRAVAAKVLADEAGYEDSMEAFTVGLVQDVGVLLMAAARPEAAAELQAAASSCGVDRLKEEIRLCGVDHPKLFRYTAAKWQLPELMVHAVGTHHGDAADTTSRRARRLATIARVADAVSDVFQAGDTQRALAIAREQLETLPSRKPLQLEQIAEQVVELMPQLAADLNIRISRQPTLQELTAEVNRSLVEITEQYERLTQELQRTLEEKQRLHRMLERANEELRRLAATDELTGVSNRRRFMQVLDHWARHAALNRQNLSVVMLDIDRFKGVNDTYGHAVGDDVLREVAVRLSQSLRATDLVGRLGGEEFAILLPGASAEAGIAIAERCREAMAVRPMSCRSGEQLTVTASFGGVTTNGGDPEDMIKAADHAMYQSKNNGRNRVTWHRGELHREVELVEVS